MTIAASFCYTAPFEDGTLAANLEEILLAYGELLSTVDQWFARSLSRFSTAIHCKSGCSSCCRGLFDITLLDACYLRKGFDALPPSLQEQVRIRARGHMNALLKVWPDMAQPYILNIKPEEEWEEMMPDEDETPCPLLGDDGACLVYAYRPMTCRLHGIPLIDVTGEMFHDEWCTLNFTGEDPLEKEELRWEFRKSFEKELSLFRSFTTHLFNQRINELDTFIPTALLIDFAGFDWKGWWRANSRLISTAGFQENR